MPDGIEGSTEIESYHNYILVGGQELGNRVQNENQHDSCGADCPKSKLV